MTDQTPPPPPPPPSYDPAAVPPPPAYGVPAQVTGPGPIGRVRSTGLCILLAIVTIGIYEIVWFYKVHDEMKRHTGRGLGGVVALILALFVGFVMPFFTAGEVGQMQELAGRQKTVQGTTGLWILLPLVGPIVWFVKTNGALNEYWRAQGAQG